MLLYADDMVLLARDQSLLQVQLDILGEFCDIVGMEVNISKSECMILNKSIHHRSNARWSYKGHLLPVNDEFVYLGVRMGSEAVAKRDKLAAKRMTHKGRAALVTMMGTCQSIGLYNPFLQRHLYHTLVAPVLSYGTEIWGPSYVGGQCAKPGAWKGEQEDVLKLFMRMCLWTPKSTPIAPTMTELGCVPVLLDFFKRIVAFWNRLAGAGTSSLHGAAFHDNIALSNLGHQSWAQGCAAMLASIGYTAVEVQDMVSSGHKLPMEDILDKANHKWALVVAHEHGLQVDDTNRIVGGNEGVREIPDDAHKGFKHIKYGKWFQVPQDAKAENVKYKSLTCLNTLFSVSHVRTVFKFRLGMSRLNCEDLRSTHSARSTRHCTRCDLSEIEDELHVLMCPSYSDLRRQFHEVFQRQEYAELKVSYDSGCRGPQLDTCMVALMNVQDASFWQKFAEYLTHIKNRRLDAIP